MKTTLNEVAEKLKCMEDENKKELLEICKKIKGNDESKRRTIDDKTTELKEILNKQEGSIQKLEDEIQGKNPKIIVTEETEVKDNDTIATCGAGTGISSIRIKNIKHFVEYFKKFFSTKEENKDSITNEATTRANEDKKLQTNITNEVAARATAVNDIIANLTSNKSSASSSTYYKLMALIYPVGSIYWSSKSTDPSTLFGGTWVQIKDKFIWAKGDNDTVNGTGGAKTVDLTVANIPAHTHSFTPAGSVSAHAHGLNNHTHSFTPAGSVSTHAHGLNNHTHSFTPAGSVSNHKHALSNTDSFTNAADHTIFTGTAVTSGGASSNNVTITDPGHSHPGHFGTSKGDRGGDYSALPVGYTTSTGSATTGITATHAHTHSVTAAGTVTGNTRSATPTFTGKAGTTGGSTANTANATPTFTGTAGTTGGNTGNTANATPTFTGKAGTTGSTGSGTAINNMPPYIIKYCWERTA